MWGQTRSSAFETVRLEMRGAQPVGESSTDEWWQRQPGVEGLIETPFYTGAVRFGASYSSFEATSADVPDFTSFWLFGGWGTEVLLQPAISLSAHVDAGHYMMAFQEVPSGKDVREAELAARVSGGVTYTFRNRLSVSGAAGYQTVFTNRRMRSPVVFIGVGYAFGTPEWLVDFVR